MPCSPVCPRKSAAACRMASLREVNVAVVEVGVAVKVAFAVAVEIVVVKSKCLPRRLEADPVPVEDIHAMGLSPFGLLHL